MNPQSSNKTILVIIAILLAGILAVLLLNSKKEQALTKTDSLVPAPGDVIPIGDTANEIDTTHSYNQPETYVNTTLGVAINTNQANVTYTASSSYVNQSSPGLMDSFIVKENGSMVMSIIVPVNSAWWTQHQNSTNNRTYVGVVTYNEITFKHYTQPQVDSGNAMHVYVTEHNGRIYEVYTQNQANLNLFSFQ